MRIGGPVRSPVDLLILPSIIMKGEAGRLEVVRIKMSSPMNHAVIWTNMWSTQVPSVDMSLQYSCHDFLWTFWSSVSYIIFSSLMVLCLDWIAKVVIFFLTHCWPLKSPSGLFSFSHAFTSGLLHCCTIAFGKQFPWPSVGLSSLSRRLHLWIAWASPSILIRKNLQKDTSTHIQR